MIRTAFRKGLPPRPFVSVALLGSMLLACSGGSSGTPEGEGSAAFVETSRRASVTGEDEASPTEPRAEGVRPPFGGPVPGLTDAELAAFERGRAVFERRFRPSEGLGPRYNASSCQSCHSTPVTGGAAQLYRNFTVAMMGPAYGVFPVPPLSSLVVPAFGRGRDFSLERGRHSLPGGATMPVFVAQRNAIPVFGTGLFEFVSDATIIANADPDDRDADGISGRFNTDSLGIGRLGTKAQANNVEAFTRTPLNTQMGITTDAFLGSAGAASLAFRAAQATGGNPNAPITDNDDVPDPELSREDLGDLIAFSRFLAPVGKRLPFSAAAERGEELFDAIGCAKCHLPSLPSSRGPLEAYTDLVIHDMGPDLADQLSLGNPQLTLSTPTGTHTEFRTQPLWGVSLFGPWLHDGRAETLREAVEMHGGEAQASRDAFAALEPDAQDDLIEFLEHL